MRIVYVEDNPANVALVERITRMNSDELITYNQPDVALEEISPNDYDLILMDVDLGNSEMNGLQLTKLLRDKGVENPIVVVTAYDANGYPEEFNAAMEAGLNEYVLKPVSVSSMIELIDAYRVS